MTALPHAADPFPSWPGDLTVAGLATAAVTGAASEVAHALTGAVATVANALLGTAVPRA